MLLVLFTCSSMHGHGLNGVVDPDLWNGGRQQEVHDSAACTGHDPSPRAESVAPGADGDHASQPPVNGGPDLPIAALHLEGGERRDPARAAREQRAHEHAGHHLAVARTRDARLRTFGSRSSFHHSTTGCDLFNQSQCVQHVQLGQVL